MPFLGRDLCMGVPVSDAPPPFGMDFDGDTFTHINLRDEDDAKSESWRVGGMRGNRVPTWDEDFGAIRRHLVIIPFSSPPPPINMMISRRGTNQKVVCE